MSADELAYAPADTHTADLPTPIEGVHVGRPRACGKFLWVGSSKLWVRGATYGAFRPDELQREYQDVAVIDRDFAQMAQAGFNTVRIPHTLPPRHLLDVAARHGLRVMVGLSAEQYSGYLADPDEGPDIDELIRTKVRTCAGHPALLCYALGNEITASMVRWLGRETVERYLKRLYNVVKREDPEGLVPRRSGSDRFTRRPSRAWRAADTRGPSSCGPGRR